MYFKYSFHALACLLFLTLSFGVSAQTTIISSGGNTVGTLTTCAQIKTTGPNGITGGTAGFQAAPQTCLTGATSTHCGGGPSFNYTYQCAGAVFVSPPGASTLPPGQDYALSYSAYDAPASATTPSAIAAHNAVTSIATQPGTDLPERGRAGDDAPLFMNAHGVCRMINKTDTVNPAALAVDPIYVGTATEDEWRSVHGAPSGNPNGGHTSVPGSPSVEMAACCAPRLIEICGQQIGTGFIPTATAAAPNRNRVQVYSDFGVAEVECTANNTLQIVDVIGVCNGSGVPSGGGGGFGGGGSIGGYSNPATGAEISRDTWGGLSTDAQADLSSQGFSADPSVDATNAEGQEAADAAQAAADAKSDTEQAEADQASDTGGTP